MARKKIDNISNLNDPNIGLWTQQVVNAINEYLTYNFVGEGSPEGAITAPVGSVYRRKDGGANTSIYVKESGVGNTGWIGK